MRVLIISQETWRDDNNGGNVLSNLFDGTGYELAQIYCSAGEPQTKLCHHFYQLTDAMMLRHMLKRHTTGRILNTEYAQTADIKTEPNDTSDLVQAGAYGFLKRHMYSFSCFVRGILWRFGGWKNKQLEDFITEFRPDVIFAPCYGRIELLRLDRYVKSVAGAPMISYVSDDMYSLRQVSFDPFFWINRLIVRASTRKTVKLYDKIYTMTEEQKRELENSWGKELTVLKKNGDFTKVPIKQSVNDPIRIIYAGSLYLNRYKTLMKLADAIRSCNRDRVHITLEIYTADQLSASIKKSLDDGKNCFLRGRVPYEQLQRIYRQQDIALHVESFRRKDKLTTRLSFSTKIIDCFASGCAVMAIAPDIQAGYRYLKEHDLALCIDRPQDIGPVLQRIVEHTEILLDYAAKVRNHSLTYHQTETVRAGFMHDFEQLAKTAERKTNVII